MIKAILYVIIRVLFRVKVVGEFQREENHTVIIANHQSFLDGLILGLFLPISPVFVVNTEIAKRPLVRLFLSLGEYLAVDPSNPMAIKQIIRLVESGRAVVIFPEGRITTTGSLMKIYEGSAFVTLKTEATIHPVIIEGATFSTLSRMGSDHPTRWFPRITLTYCTPTRLVISEGEVLTRDVPSRVKRCEHCCKNVFLNRAVRMISTEHFSMRYPSMEVLAKLSKIRNKSNTLMVSSLR